METNSQSNLMATEQKMTVLTKRLVASLIDLGIIIGSGFLVLSALWAAASVFGISLVATSGGAGFSNTADIVFYVFIYGSFTAAAGLFVRFWIGRLLSTGVTPGKRMLGLVLIGQRPGFWRYLLRELVKYLPVTAQMLAWAAGLLGVGLPDHAASRAVVFVLAAMVYFVMPFAWIASFVLSAGGRFPHDAFFGTKVTIKTPTTGTDTPPGLKGHTTG